MDTADAAVDVIENKSRTFGVGRKRYERSVAVSEVLHLVSFWVFTFFWW